MILEKFVKRLLGVMGSVLKSLGDVFPLGEGRTNLWGRVSAILVWRSQVSGQTISHSANSSELSSGLVSSCLLSKATSLSHLFLSPSVSSVLTGSSWGSPPRSEDKSVRSLTLSSDSNPVFMGFGSCRSDIESVSSGDSLLGFAFRTDLLGGGSELSSVSHSSGIDCHSSSGSGLALLNRLLALVPRDCREGDEVGSSSGPPRRDARMDLVAIAFSR